MRITIAVTAGAALLLSGLNAQALESSAKAASKLSADALWAKIGDFCGISKWHPAVEKDANRRGDFPNQMFDFLGFKFARKALGRGGCAFACFLPAASPKALTSISRTIRRWTLHHRSDKALQELAEMYNPYIQGWINYSATSIGHSCVRP